MTRELQVSIDIGHLKSNDLSDGLSEKIHTFADYRTEQNILRKPVIIVDNLDI